MIDVRGVSFARGSRTILSDVTYSFERARVYVVRGPSGTGKSTLLNLLAGYLTPDAGTVTRHGDAEYLMQEELLFSALSAHENLRIRALGSRPDLDETRVDAEIDRTLLALGLRGRTDDPVSSLSGGERRRVELAGMTLANPDILLLDEPAANLDAANARRMYTAIWETCNERTVVLVTHETEADRFPGGAVHLDLGASSWIAV
jgi:ABC-type multidrug transport system ATPase subunit